jgi:hypothetical protein
MKRLIFVVTLFALLLSACGNSQPAPTATVTSLPTDTPIPTVAATATVTSIPKIDVGGIQVPDPKFTNPELFDLKNPDSPIVQFANAFGVKPEEVSKSLHAELETPEGLPAFAVMRTSDGVTLLMATQNEDKEWDWQKATPGIYWLAQGKLIGAYLDGDEFNYAGNLEIFDNFFAGGIIALNGQVRPNADRPPSNANRMADNAHSNNMSLFFHYVVEPGKFPSNVNTTNVDSWLDTRLEGIIQVLKRYKAEGHPMYLSFNEAWEGNEWNEEANPLRDKYGNKWVDEYVFQLLSKFVNDGFVPNKDFVIVFNDADLYNSPNKQDLVFHTLSEARLNAFKRLMVDPNIAQILQQMGINKPEDINILLGVETHANLGQKIDNGINTPAPTKDQIFNLSNKFASLGGILMTEVNPNGTSEQQGQFLKDIFSSLKGDSNLKGIILWNLFNPNDPNDIFTQDRLELFDNSGRPTQLFFALLR